MRLVALSDAPAHVTAEPPAAALPAQERVAAGRHTGDA